jgi:hypothetical protein
MTYLQALIFPRVILVEANNLNVADLESRRCGKN